MVGCGQEDGDFEGSVLLTESLCHVKEGSGTFTGELCPSLKPSLQMSWLRLGHLAAAQRAVASIFLELNFIL